MSNSINPLRPLPRAEQFAAPYWEALKRGEFLLPKDLQTGKFFFPTRAINTEQFEWAPASREGKIVSYSWVHLQPSEGYADQLPYLLATVALDDGPQMMCNILDAQPEDVFIGRRVSLVLEERADGWVIPQFTPS